MRGGALGTTQAILPSSSQHPSPATLSTESPGRRCGNLQARTPLFHSFSPQLNPRSTLCTGHSGRLALASGNVPVGPSLFCEVTHSTHRQWQCPCLTIVASKFILHEVFFCLFFAGFRDSRLSACPFSVPPPRAIQFTLGQSHPLEGRARWCPSAPDAGLHLQLCRWGWSPVGGSACSEQPRWELNVHFPKVYSTSFYEGESLAV